MLSQCSVSRYNRLHTLSQKSHTKYKHVTDRQKCMYTTLKSQEKKSQLASSTHESSRNRIYNVQGLLRELSKVPPEWQPSAMQASRPRKCVKCSVYKNTDNKKNTWYDKGKNHKY